MISRLSLRSRKPNGFHIVRTAQLEGHSFAITVTLFFLEISITKRQFAYCSTLPKTRVNRRSRCPWMLRLRLWRARRNRSWLLCHHLGDRLPASDLAGLNRLSDRRLLAGLNWLNDRRLLAGLAGRCMGLLLRHCSLNWRLLGRLHLRSSCGHLM